ncbi:MAG: hypothetical protein IJQ68_10290 [Methanobrevibacter sp.]|uniref:hypothetical protein n=1 Tax=Methanobrevibacter sp. TaxID=66852 RepID=UPI0025EE333D|nr:hypothetical protein [Methanobrevibacter sp.]MBR0272355.1 hypothetical protein [Methanobrevibacter sp.]
MTCPGDKYVNPGLSSFGEQRYVTADLLRTFCNNDEYLKKQIEKLEYLTPPAVRKNFKPIPVDESKSYGYKIQQNNNITFNKSTLKTLNFNFDDLSIVDTAKTTAVWKSFLDDNRNVQHKFELPLVTLDKGINKETRNYSPWTIRDEDGNVVSDDMTCNEFWYIGFDRNRHYEVRPNWLFNMLNGEIPGITRAQTFVAKSSGLLENVVLNLQGGTNTGMPLVVEIRKTEKIDDVYVPVNSDVNHLAYQEVKFNNTNPGVYSVTFDYPCTVKEGETYAIVLLSPLSHSTNCYAVGGWNKHCHADNTPNEHAFYSFNCGYTWIRYGKDEDVDYHQGKYAPQDFSYQCHIRELGTAYSTDECYLYLKPIFDNPIKSVTLGAECEGSTATSGYTLKYEVSNDGHTWKSISNGGTIYFENPVNVLFVRAIFKSTNGSKTPYIESLGLTLSTDLPREMYVRTPFYYPQLSCILGASVWGRIFAPFDCDPTTTCGVEIIREKEVMEHFIIIEPSDLIYYTYIEGIEASDIEGKTANQLKTYLTNKPSIVSLLKEHNIYVIGFIDEFKFINKPAYPMINASLQPSAVGSSTVNYGEWYDYIIDYDENILTLSDYNLENLVKGTLTVSYNPVFIEGLTNEEVGLRADKTEGLILDYFEETFIVDNEMVETRNINLRTEPIDPIRKFTLIKSNGEELNLYENIDYVLSEKNILLEITNFDGESPIIAEGDIIKIVYTPNLDDNAISIGYYAKRENTDKQVNIKPNYIEYKV